MATASLRIPHADRFTAWFPDFLMKELAPYPGRAAMVARTVIAATITMILIVTFRIPGGVVGVLSAFILSRENLASTARSAGSLIGAFLFGALFAPIGACFFASTPATHFLWEGSCIFFCFLMLRTLANYAVATGLTIVATNILPIWYLPGPVEHNIETTLWFILAAVIGSVVTFAVEAVFHALNPSNELIDGIEFRLLAVQTLLEAYAKGDAPASETQNRLAQFALVGVGGLRRHLARTSYERLYRTRMSTLVSLTGRSVDFAAALSTSVTELPAAMRTRAERLARHIADMRHCMATSGEPCESDFKPEPSPTAPLLFELESMVSLMPTVFSSTSAIDPRLEVLESASSNSRIFAENAFSNPENMRFVLSGTLAAMSCYVLYVSLAWPGLSTSVTTCLLTALTNVGASRQKQVLRIAGAILGGFVFGMGAQIFVLPNIDSITGFTVLFATVTAIAAWIGTSSSRLSYAGVQMALAFYLVHLSEFSIQTSLAVARDRSIGVLLGSTMMWIVFERFYPRKAADEMIRVFVRNLRLMADLLVDTPANADATAILAVRKKRDQVYSNFGEVNAQADAVPFETGAQRAGDMAARDRIRRWQASLRTFYLLEIPLVQFLVFNRGNEKSETFTNIEDAFRSASAQTLLHMATNIEIQLNERRHDTQRDPALALVLEGLQKECKEEQLSERERALLALSQTVALLLDRFQNEVVAESIYSTN